ncbi:MAG TPA: glycosyltransferase family 4 protein [Anaerolineaceae bacterium]|nr:glycosyltransferase family 4 protein [Anaerolineaceae bacterium]
MKIAFVSQPLDSVSKLSSNSIGIWTTEVARRLAAVNDVIVYARGKEWKAKREHEGKLIFEFKPAASHRTLRRISSRAAWLSTHKRPFFASPLYHFEYALQVALDIRQRNCNVIHIQNISQFVPIIRALNPRAKIALHMHCEWLTQLDREMIAKRLRKVDLILGCSDYITQTIQRQFPEYAAICQTIYNGVDTRLFSSPISRVNHAQTDKLLMVGRVSPEKGTHTLVEAYVRIAPRYPQLKLEVVGSIGVIPVDYIVKLSDDPTVRGLERFYQGNYFETLKKMIPKELHERIHFQGYIGHDLLVPHYQSADILVNPSLSESFGMSLIEAMSCGVPVVATRVGGMVDVVEEGKTGFLVPPDAPQDLAQAISDLMSNPALREEMGRAGKIRANDLFSWENIVSQLLLGYEKNLSSQRHDVHKKIVAEHV